MLSRRAPSAPSRAVVARATPAKPEPTFDFDKITADAVKRFEKAENKPVAAAWIFAFSAGILGAEASGASCCEMVAALARLSPVAALLACDAHVPEHDSCRWHASGPLLPTHRLNCAPSLSWSQYLMHLPLLNALLGFPVQLLGLLMLPYLGIR